MRPSTTRSAGEWCRAGPCLSRLGYRTSDRLCIRQVVAIIIVIVIVIVIVIRMAESIFFFIIIIIINTTTADIYAYYACVRRAEGGFLP
jgi:hypothetical protein